MSPLESSAASPIDPAPCPAAADVPESPGPIAVVPACDPARSWLQSISIWFVGCLLASLAMAWLSFQIKLGGHAPELLFPIGVGLGLGFALVAVSRYSGFSVGRFSVAATILWGLLAVLGPEYFAHLDHRRNWLDVQNRSNLSAFARLAAGEMPPPGFAADLIIDIRHRGPWAWSFDALATVLSATIVVACKARAAAKSAGPTGPAATGASATRPEATA